MKLKKLKNLKLILLFLLVRLISVFCVQTFFVPDEYYQSLEIAHKLIFGYGYLTWEWQNGIRSYGYPLIIAFIYKILKIFNLDSPWTVIYYPRIFQALLSTYSDLCFYQWSGSQKWATFTILTSWFWFYTCSRTLINTFEANLITIALSKFPWIGKNTDASSSESFLWIASILFVIRPTSAIIWLPLCIYHIAISSKSFISLFITSYVKIGITTLIASIVIDSTIHGSLIITPIKFLQFNIFQNIAINYGTQPWHWYLSEGLPAVLGIQILPFIMGIFIILKARHNHPNELAILGIIIFAISILSCLPHKEFRFLLPVLSLILHIAAQFLSAWSRKAKTYSIWLVSVIIFFGNFFPGWYLATSHQRGTLDVMNGLRNIAIKDPENVFFLFLMPCHSTPLYSHLHMNVTTKFLTCNPNLNGTRDNNYIEEADEFYANPNFWLRKNYPPQNGTTLPSHIICYENLIPLIGNDILTHYKRTKQYFHCNIPISTKIGNYVLIHERKDFEISWTTNK